MAVARREVESRNIEHVRYIQIVSMSRLSQTRTIVPLPNNCDPRKFMVQRDNYFDDATSAAPNSRNAKTLRRRARALSSSPAACKCFVEQTVNLAEIQKDHLETRGTVDAYLTIGENFKIMNIEGGVH